MKLAMGRMWCCRCDMCHPPPIVLPSQYPTPESRLLAARATLALVVAAAVGFSTSESMLYTACTFAVSSLRLRALACSRHRRVCAPYARV